MLVLFLLVLDHQPIQLVGEHIDGRIHGLAVGLGVEGLAWDVHAGVDVVVGLLKLQCDPRVAMLIEVLADPRQLLLYVGMKGRGDFDIFAKRFDAHRVSPLFG